MKRMIPFLSLGLSLAMLLGGAQLSMQTVQAKADTSRREETVKEKEVMAIDRVADCFDQFRKLKKKGNYIYSPESMNSALCIYQYVTEKEENRAVIKQLIGDTDYLAYKNNKKSFKLVNRIWKNKDKDMKIADEIKKYVYEMDMTDSVAATKEKNDFVSKKTNNFIKSTPTELNKDTVFDIMNITYFKDKWSCGDLRKDKSKHDFTTESDKKTATKYLHYDNARRYYENKTALAVEVPYKDGFSLLMIRPKKTLSEVKMADLFNSTSTADKIRVKFPEFEIKSSFDLTDYFKGMGITKESADTDITIQQVARIKVDKKGTEAAAVSEIICGTTAIRDKQPKIVNIYMNKPFYYAILDKKNNDVAFMGQVTTLPEAK